MPKKVSYKEWGGGWYFKAPAGWHPAIIVWVMELGTEMRSFKEWEEPKAMEEIRILFEIEAEQEKYDSEKWELTWEMEEKIGIIWANYNDVISDKSKLGKVINAICDVKSVKEIKDFSLDQLLGMKCFIDVEMKGKDLNYETITSVSWQSKKVNYHEQETKSFYFWMEDPDDFLDILDDDIAKKYLKPWDLDRVKASPEFKALMKSFGIEVAETMDEQEENMKAEAEERKETQAKADAEPTVSSDDAKGIFNGEPETTTKARANAKAKEEAEKVEAPVETAPEVPEVEAKEETPVEVKEEAPKKTSAFE